MLSRPRFKLHSVYDAGVEFQITRGTMMCGVQYAELNQQGSGEVTNKVRMELSPVWDLMGLSPGSVNPVICCSWPSCLFDSLQVVSGIY